MGSEVAWHIFVNFLYRNFYRMCMPRKYLEKIELMRKIEELKINTEEFDRKFEENVKTGKIRFTKIDFYENLENLLVRLSLVGFFPKIFVVPDMYGERFRVLTNAGSFDILNRLQSRKTMEFRNKGNSDLERMTEIAFEFLFATKNSCCEEILEILEQYNLRENPLRNHLVLQCIVDKCHEISELEKLNIIMEKIKLRDWAEHALKPKLSHLLFFEKSESLRFSLP